jgi:hypothetical protein
MTFDSDDLDFAPSAGHGLGQDVPGSGGFGEPNSAEAFAAYKKSRFSRRGKAIAVSVAGIVLASSAGAYAMYSKSNVNLYVALASWARSDVTDVALSINVKPAALTRTGASDVEISGMNLPGIMTAQDYSDALRQTRLHIQSSRGTSNIDDAKFAISLEYGSASVADIRVIDRALYIQSDVSALPKVSPQVVTQRQITDSEDAIKAYGEFLGSDSFIMRLVNAVMAGDAVSASFKKGTALGDLMDQELAQATPTPGVDEASTDNISNLIIDSLKASGTVASEGSDEIGHRFLLTIDLSKFANEVVAQIRTIDLGLLDAQRDDIELELSKLAIVAKRHPLLVRMWAGSTDLKRMEVDLSQLINLSEPTARLESWDVSLVAEIGNQAPAAPPKSVDFTEELNALFTLIS